MYIETHNYNDQLGAKNFWPFYAGGYYTEKLSKAVTSINIIIPICLQAKVRKMYVCSRCAYIIAIQLQMY